MFGLSTGATILFLASFVPGMLLVTWFFFRLTRLERKRAAADSSPAVGRASPADETEEKS